MATDQFTFVPISATLSNKPALYTAPFGDGYEQNLPKGLNPTPDVYSLQFKPKSIAVARQIIAFFKLMNGYKRFTWTPKNATKQGLWLCKSWQEKEDPGGITVITATFEQQFGA